MSARILHPERLAGVDTRLSVDLVRAWELELTWDICIIFGIRTEEEQARLYAQGRTMPGKVVTFAATAEKSAHGHAGAIDAMPMVGSQIIWTSKHAEWPIAAGRLDAMARIARRLGLVCGADFKMRDIDHFEVPDWRALPVVSSVQPAVT